MGVALDAFRRAYLMLARDDKPAAASDNRGMVVIERGAPDLLRYSRIAADGVTPEWATPRVAGEKVAAADIDASALTNGLLNVIGGALGSQTTVAASAIDASAIASGSLLKVVGGALAGIAPAAPEFGWGVKDRTAVNVTSTSGASIAELQASVTLASGYLWDLFFFGGIAANAPSGQFISIGATINNGAVPSFGWADTGTVGGERTLPFGGYQKGIVGDNASHACFARGKVTGGTGTVNAGWCMAVALPRLP